MAPLVFKASRGNSQRSLNTSLKWAGHEDCSPRSRGSLLRGLDPGQGLWEVAASCAEYNLHLGYITVYLHSLQSQASCRLRGARTRSNGSWRLQCQLPLAPGPGPGGQIRRQVVFGTAEPRCPIVAVQLMDGSSGQKVWVHRGLRWPRCVKTRFSVSS